MIKLPGYLFIIGALASYAPLFITDRLFAFIASVIGTVLNLYIWYSLASNRDSHLKRMVDEKVVTETEMKNLGISMKTRATALLYCFFYIAMNLSGSYAMSVVFSEIDSFEAIPTTEEMLSNLGTPYLISAIVFTLSGIFTLILFYRLFKAIYSDEIKIQSIESMKKGIPVISIKPISFLVVLLFTVITYGLFSWVLRFRLNAAQVIHKQFEEKMSKIIRQRDNIQQKAVFEQEKRKNMVQTVTEKYKALLLEPAEPDKRKEIVASLFRDLGSLETIKAKEIVESFFDNKLLTERECKQLTKLLV